MVIRYGHIEFFASSVSRAGTNVFCALARYC